MSIQDLITSGGGIVLTILTIIQVAPIKLNPWTHIAKTIGKSINMEVIDKIDLVNEELKKLDDKQKITEENILEKEADNCRTRILRFADELRRDIRHSEEFFNEIMTDITKYDRYCLEHPKYKNNKAQNAIAQINEVYKKCAKENLFL